MMVSREEVLDAIRKCAEASGGQPPGRNTFEHETGIKEVDWRGRYWARWSDAVSEAGFVPNRAPERMDENQLLLKLSTLVRELGRCPTVAEMKLFRRHDPTFPSSRTIYKHFPQITTLWRRLHEYAIAKPDMADIAAICRETLGSDVPDERASGSDLGSVYLIRWDKHYKIGKASNLERRVREIKISLPEAAEIVHAIKTDDPDGIEAYWHRRFNDRRVRGEWFALSVSDVAAFKRRRFQ